MRLIDTHCHVHDSEFYPENREEAYAESREVGVTMLCVGTDQRSSRQAVEFSATHEGCFAIVGVHPHESKHGWSDIETIVAQAYPQVVGIGEIGLDYFYDHSPRDTQHAALREQLALAVRYDLPVSFHVRDRASTSEGVSVWDDFWPIIDEYPTVRGVLHSFTDTRATLEQALNRNLYIGVNGISTFTKDPIQQTLYAELPIDKILLETDAPYLTPHPLRGRMNLPAYVGRVAEHQARSKHMPIDLIARSTTHNAQVLFGDKINAEWFDKKQS